MSFYTRIVKHPSLFFNITGMKLAEFSVLLPRITAQYELIEQSRKEKTVILKQPRRRAIGGGNAYKNDVADRILMALMYYRLYLTQEFMALLFAVDHKSTVCRSIQSVLPALEAVLPTPARVKSAVLSMAEKAGAKLPKRISTIEEFVRAYPELAILIDGKEQPIPRPKDSEKRTATYSGKKKRHTIKQIIGTTAKGLITDLSPPFDGSVHDFTAFKHYSSTLSQGWSEFRCVAYLDAGFQGCQQLNLPFKCRQIQKAFRNKPLTQEQKELNHIRSKIRIKCEHSIGLTKKYRIASEIYRNPQTTYETTINIVAGLANLRMIRRIETQTKQQFNW